MPERRKTKGVHKGPRSRRIVESVREATVAELARIGFGDLSIDGVAKAAGVNRTTIYRRWPNKSALVEAVLEPLLEPFADAPNRGSLGEDLRALIEALRANLSSDDGRALMQVLAANNPDLSETVVAAGEIALGAFEGAFVRARERGELDPDADVEMMCHLTFFGLIGWTQRHARFPSEEECERLLGLTLASVA